MTGEDGRSPEPRDVDAEFARMLRDEEFPARPGKRRARGRNPALDRRGRVCYSFHRVCPPRLSLWNGGARRRFSPRSRTKSLN